jgi:hypothetical protein
MRYIRVVSHVRVLHRQAAKGVFYISGHMMGIFLLVVEREHHLTLGFARQPFCAAGVYALPSMEVCDVGPLKVSAGFCVD